MKNNRNAKKYFFYLFFPLLVVYSGKGYSQKGNYSILCVDRNYKQDLWAVVLNNDQSEKILDIVSITSDTFPVTIINRYLKKKYIITSANYTGVKGKRINLTLTKFENDKIAQHIFYKTWNSLKSGLRDWRENRGYQPTIAIDFKEFKKGNKDSLLLMVAVTKGLKSLENVKQAVVRFESDYRDLMDDIAELREKNRNIRFFACTSMNYYAILQDESLGFAQDILERSELTQATLDSIYKAGREIAALTSSPGMWYIVTEKSRERDQHTIISPTHYPSDGIQQYLDFNRQQNQPVVTTDHAVTTNIEGIKIHGLFAGVDNYSLYRNNNLSEASNLGSCVNDADSVYRYFERFGNLTKTKGNLIFLPDKKAEKGSILKWAEKMGAEAGPHDMLIIYFSGHGAPGNYCTYDSSLSYAELKQVLVKSNANINFVISDCCYAGSWDIGAKSKTVTKNGGPESFSAMLQQIAPGYVQLFSSKRDQTSLAGNPNSLFTEVLMEGLRGKADNIEKDGMITIEEINSYLVTEVARRSDHSQEPEMKGNNDEIKKLPICFLKY